MKLSGLKTTGKGIAQLFFVALLTAIPIQVSVQVRSAPSMLAMVTLWLDVWFGSRVSAREVGVTSMSGTTTVSFTPTVTSGSSGSLLAMSRSVVKTPGASPVLS